MDCILVVVYTQVRALFDIFHFYYCSNYTIDYNLYYYHNFAGGKKSLAKMRVLPSLK